ncbi:urease accessory protein UreD [Tropicibacter oceani]|uniref:Urease accessory protein UreD n=1 Tax=Tropicibacter oceani TaxID=3058420 RepID=A0ABY8QHT8_9RHOB|nr:urease accessory protein UreD [Tropicibacter oceani]WGW03546.1 urease accessory protein UreD [Tropicibacter oceani]
MPEDPAIPYDQTSRAAPAASLPQRARGQAHLSVRTRAGASVLGDLHMSGSSKLLFPRARGAELDAVYLNSAGGVTGGDRFALSATVDEGAALRMTTQAAERIYRAAPGAPGHVSTRLTAHPGAQITWLPQETIIYDGASLDRRLTIDLAQDARLLACEVLVFGRRAMGEAVHELFLRDRIDLHIGGALAFADRLRLDGDAAAVLNRAAVADGAIAVASVLCAAPGIGGRLDHLRELLPPQAGGSALTEDLVFLRLLAPDSFELRKTLVPLLHELAQDDLPRPWML